MYECMYVCMYNQQLLTPGCIHLSAYTFYRRYTQWCKTVRSLQHAVPACLLVALEEVQQADDIEEHVSQSKAQGNPGIHTVVVL